MKKHAATILYYLLLLIIFIEYYWNVNLVSNEIFAALIILAIFNYLYFILSHNSQEFAKLRKSTSDIYQYNHTAIDWLSLFNGFACLLQTTFPHGEKLKLICTLGSILFFGITILNFILQKTKKHHVLGLTDSKIINLQNRKTIIDLENVTNYVISEDKIKLQTNWTSETIDSTKFYHSAGLINQIATRIDALKNKSAFVTPIPPK